MSPVKFPECNVKLLPSGHEYSMAVESIEPLHGFSDGEQFITCWEPTPEEREAIAAGGKIWLQVLSGNAMSPVALTVAETIFR